MGKKNTDGVCYACHVLAIEFDHEEDGRWIAEVPDVPGVLAYGETRDDAMRAAVALALRVVADRLEHGERVPEAVLIGL